MQFAHVHLQDISEQKKRVLDATQSKTSLLNVWKFVLGMGQLFLTKFLPKGLGSTFGNLCLIFVT